MTAQIITTDGGEELVVLPRAEYERLLDAVEEAGDLAYLQARRDEPCLPLEVGLAVINGEISPVEAWRRQQGLNQAELAGKAGVRAATISDIESGKSQGSIPVLRRIASALGVDLDDLVPDAEG